MGLTLYFHPLSSFCHKALIALYEAGTPFEPVVVDLGDPASRAAFAAVWPMAKMPVLRDAARDCTVAESSVVVEYLDAHYPGSVRLIPADADGAWRTRMWDRFHDCYVQEPMQRIVGDALRPEGKGDAFGVEQARAALERAYSVLEDELAGKQWACGAGFGLADCSAAPALFYADTVVPIGDAFPALRAYLARLKARPSFARVLTEAQPYFPMFPLARKPAL